MPLTMKARAWLLASGCLLACGPETREPSQASDWIREGLSQPGVGVGTLSVYQYEFDPEGNVTMTTLSTAGECGNQSRTTEYVWRDAGDGTIEVTDLDGGPMDGGPGDRTVFQINRDRCSQFDVNGQQWVDLLHFKDGEQLSAGPPDFVRGKLCLREEPPCPGTECDGCRTVWCEGEAPEPYACDG